MVETLWQNFPRLIERNIDALLDEAEPNALRKLQIFRALKNDGLSSESVDGFLAHLGEFLARPRAERRKSHFDAHLARPMSHEVYGLFRLDFRCAVVPDEALSELASWAHNLIRVSKKTTARFMSRDVLLATLRRLTSPHHDEKSENIRCADFCAAWRRTVRTLASSPNDPEFEELLREIEWLDRESERSELGRIETSFVPGIFLDAGELDWVIAVREAAFAHAEAPKPPREIDGSKPLLKDFARVVSLYAIARTSRLPEIVKNRERIRATVLDRCDALIGRESGLAG